MRIVLLAICGFMSLQLHAQNQSDFYLSYQHEFGFLNTEKTQSYQLQAKYFVLDELSFNYYIGARQFKSTNQLNFHMSSGPLIGVPTATVGLGVFVVGAVISSFEKDNECDELDYLQISDGYCASYDINSIYFDPEDPDCHTCQEEEKLGLKIAGRGLGLMAVGLIASIIPEEVEYHFSITNNLRISPFLSFGGVDIYKDQNETKIKWQYGLGTRLSLMNFENRLHFSIHGAYKGVSSFGHGWHYGLSLGARI